MANLSASAPPAVPVSGPSSLIDLLTGDNRQFTASLGSWVNSGGTMTRDTSVKFDGLSASLKHVSSAAGQYVEVPIPGTFKLGSEYHFFMALELESTGITDASWRVQGGLIGTDAFDSGAPSFNPTVTTYWTGAGKWAVIAYRWRPTANRTGVTFRFSRPNANASSVQNWHIGWAAVYKAPHIGGAMAYGAPWESGLGDNNLTGTYVGPNPIGQTENYIAKANLGGGFWTGSFDNIGMKNNGNNSGVAVQHGYQYVWASHTTLGDMPDDGWNLEVGSDNVGMYVTEKDANTVQFYADASGGYTMQLRHRNGKGWAVSEDGTTNRRIESYFENRVTVAGALTTGTDKGGASQVIQLPFKAKVDEVRVYAATAPTGANVLVDVNAAGTTIFTTQANRPAVGLSVKNLTSGGASGSAASFNTAPVTLRAGQLYLVSVENSHASAAAVLTGISSAITGYLTMTSRSSTTFNGGLNRVSIWSGVATADWTGILVASWAANQTGFTWSVDEVTGVDTATNDGVVQQAVGTGTSTTPLATLAAFATAANGAYAAHGHAAATATTPGTGWTELSDATTTGQAIETAYRVDNDTTADATITSAAWGSCAVELTTSKSATSRLPDGGTSIAKNTAITVDIDQIGSGVAGSDLTVLIRGTAIW